MRCFNEVLGLGMTIELSRAAMLLDNLATKWLNCSHDKEAYRFGYSRLSPEFPGSPSYRGKAGR